MGMVTGTEPRLATALLVAGLAVAGCGGGGSSDNGNATPPPPAAGGTTLRLQSEPNTLAFDKKTLTAKAGQVTIVMSNPSPTPHNVAVKGGKVDEQGEVVGEGGTSQVTATLTPGRYTFYCSVPGHRAAGMKGTLTVK
jgi:plastocyanin